MRGLLFIVSLLVAGGAAAQEDAKAAARAECERLRDAEVQAAYDWDGKGDSPIPALVAKREVACAAYERIVDEQRQAEAAAKAKRKAEAEAAVAEAEAADALRREVAAEAARHRAAEAERRRKAEAEEIRQIEAFRQPVRRTPKRATPRCKKGKPCGRSCIATWKTCRK